MKIVCENTKEHAALAAALSLEHPTIMWNPASKNGFDMWDEIQPELIICSQAVLDKYKSLFTCLTYSKKIPKDLANTCQYLGGVYNSKYASDFVYFSDEPQTPEILQELALYQNVQLRIYGDFPISLPNYVGRVSLKEIPTILASTKTLIDVSGNWWRNAYLYNKKISKYTSRDDSREEVFLEQTYLNLGIDILKGFDINTTKLEDKVNYIYEKYGNNS